MLTKDKYRGICRIHTCSSCSIKMINQSAVKKKKLFVPCTVKEYCACMFCNIITDINILPIIILDSILLFYFINKPTFSFSSMMAKSTKDR